MKLHKFDAVDQATAYIRGKSKNPFLKRRLEDVLGGRTVTEIFYDDMLHLRELYGEGSLDDHIDSYNKSFITNILVPFTDICGFQIKTEPASDVNLYLVFGQWWQTKGEGEAASHTYPEVMRLLQRGFAYHSRSSDLHMVVAQNYYNAMFTAYNQEEWGRVLTCARRGDYHWEKAVSLGFSVNPVLAKDITLQKGKAVGQAEEVLRQVGKE